MDGLCECGCGQPTPVSKKTVREKGWVKGVSHRFIKGHNAASRVWTPESRERLSKAQMGLKLGIKLSDETRRRMSLSRRAEKGNNWKGDRAGYRAIHIWVTKWHPKTGICENCGIARQPGKRAHDYANLSQTYQRDRSDWMELCQLCHKRMDLARLGRLRTPFVVGSR